MQPESGAAQSVSCGAVDLVFQAGPPRTTPRRRLAVPPLQISRARYDDAADLQKAVLTMSQLGGILDGDRYDVRVQLEPAARARLVSAGATAVYPALTRGGEHCVRLSLASNSRLEWLPEPLILYAGARFRQQTRVELAPGARLVFCETFAPGRLARGELFAFERYESSFEVYAAPLEAGSTPRLLLSERSDIAPATQPIWTLPPFVRQPVFGSLYILGNIEQPEELVQALQSTLPDQGGVTVLPNGAGVLVRIVGSIPARVKQQLMRCWQACRLE